jgi:hypothetical protein
MQGGSPEGSPFRHSFCFDQAPRARNSVARLLDRFGSIVAGHFREDGGIEMFASEPHCEVCDSSIFGKSLLLNKSM